MKNKRKLWGWMKIFFVCYALLVIGIIFFDLVFMSESNLSTTSNNGGETLDQDIYLIFFLTDIEQEKQQEILTGFPQVTYLKNGSFPSIARVTIDGDVKTIASNMRSHQDIMLVRNLSGASVCH